MQKNSIFILEILRELIYSGDSIAGSFARDPAETKGFLRPVESSDQQLASAFI